MSGLEEADASEANDEVAVESHKPNAAARERDARVIREVLLVERLDLCNVLGARLLYVYTQGGVSGLIAA